MDHFLGKKMVEGVGLTAFASVTLASGIGWVSNIEQDSTQQLIEFQKTTIGHHIAALKAYQSISNEVFENCHQLWSKVLDDSQVDWKKHWKPAPISANKHHCGLEFISSGDTIVVDKVSLVVI